MAAVAASKISPLLKHLHYALVYAGARLGNLS
jgi:hypothetical protein